MEKMEFELQGEGFYVQSVMARQGCDVLARNPGTLRCVVESNVSSEVFRVFLSAIEGNAVEVTNKNVDDLSALCKEFEFWSLLERVRAFEETPTYQIKELEKLFQDRLSRVEAELKRQSQAQESTAASLTVALALKGDVKRSAAHFTVGGDGAGSSEAADENHGRSEWTEWCHNAVRNTDQAITLKNRDDSSFATLRLSCTIISKLIKA
jgi:hypothetical protein